MKKRRRKAASRGHVDIYAPWLHDEHTPGFYHVIFNSSCDSQERFGVLVGDARFAPGSPNGAYVKPTSLGDLFLKCLRQWKADYPFLDLFECRLMPDHIHMLVNLLNRPVYIFSHYIYQLLILFDKEREWNRSPHSKMFSLEFRCKPLRRDDNIFVYQEYLRTNPHRLAMRLQYPQFFCTVRRVIIAGREYEAYGNLFFLRNPDKLLVRIGDQEGEWKKTQMSKVLINAMDKGSIIVSPLLSTEEKGIFEVADYHRFGTIIVRHEELGTGYRPGSADVFESCCRGWFLIVSLGYPVGTLITPEIESELYNLADCIASYRY